jgi:hypothetical protein
MIVFLRSVQHTFLIYLKIGHFTLDNAGNNKTMMEALEKKLEERDIPFDATDRRIMCYAHVVNLCSGAVIRAAGDGDGTLELNPIGVARGVVRAVRVSGKRRDAFDEVIRDGNRKAWFKAGQPPEVIIVKELQLLRDVRTRWDSVYLMLNRLREMRPV